MKGAYTCAAMSRESGPTSNLSVRQAIKEICRLLDAWAETETFREDVYGRLNKAKDDTVPSLQMADQALVRLREDIKSRIGKLWNQLSEGMQQLVKKGLIRKNRLDSFTESLIQRAAQEAAEKKD